MYMEEEFNQAVEMYYELKNRYNSIKTKSNKKPKKIEQKCIKCKKAGGTIFTTENNQLVAYCNNHSSPCDLDIRLYKGVLIYLPTWLESNMEKIEDLKLQIMKDKYDLLFGFINEEVALERFQPRVEEFNKLNEVYSLYLTKYLEILYQNKNKLLISKNNEELSVLINNVKELNEEFNKAIDEDNLDKRLSLSQEIVNLYKTQIYPKVKDIRNLKYQTNSIKTERVDKNKLVFNLIQNKYDETQLFTYKNDEFPKVIAFNV